eukprot:14061931-Alexandrium_andersonii.AAC.1
MAWRALISPLTAIARKQGVQMHATPPDPQALRPSAGVAVLARLECCAIPCNPRVEGLRAYQAQGRYRMCVLNVRRSNP